MHVTCPTCARAYSLALFSYGRTISCACGERIGTALLERELAVAGERRFAADSMLRGLARWLRLLGFDTVWEPQVADALLVRRAVDERRIILTQDRSLPREWRVSGIQLLAADRPRDQLREVVAAFGLGPEIRLFTRCSRCNTPLLPAEREKVLDRVPARARPTDRDVARCPTCGRVYWEGSHTARIRREVADVGGAGGPA